MLEEAIFKENSKIEERRQKKIYLDKTWINEGHFVNKVWQAFIEGLIISHIGGDKGFVNEGLLDFISNSTKVYYEEITANVF